MPLFLCQMWICHAWPRLASTRTCSCYARLHVSAVFHSLMPRPGNPAQRSQTCRPCSLGPAGQPFNVLPCAADLPHSRHLTEASRPVPQQSLRTGHMIALSHSSRAAICPAARRVLRTHPPGDATPHFCSHPLGYAAIPHQTATAAVRSTACYACGQHFNGHGRSAHAPRTALLCGPEPSIARMDLAPKVWGSTCACCPVPGEDTCACSARRPCASH